MSKSSGRNCTHVGMVEPTSLFEVCGRRIQDIYWMSLCPPVNNPEAGAIIFYRCSAPVGGGSQWRRIHAEYMRSTGSNVMWMSALFHMSLLENNTR